MDQQLGQHFIMHALKRTVRRALSRVRKQTGKYDDRVSDMSSLKNYRKNRNFNATRLSSQSADASAQKNTEGTNPLDEAIAAIGRLDKEDEKVLRRMFSRYFDAAVNDYDQINELESTRWRRENTSYSQDERGYFGDQEDDSTCRQYTDDEMFDTSAVDSWNTDDDSFTDPRHDNRYGDNYHPHRDCSSQVPRQFFSTKQSASFYSQSRPNPRQLSLFLRDSAANTDSPMSTPSVSDIVSIKAKGPIRYKINTAPAPQLYHASKSKGMVMANETKITSSLQTIGNFQYRTIAAEESDDSCTYSEYSKLLKDSKVINIQERNLLIGSRH